MEWTDLEFIRDVIATQGWQKLADEESQSVEANSGYDQALSRLSSRFKVPLEAARVVVGFDEFRDMLSYATIHFSFQH